MTRCIAYIRQPTIRSMPDFIDSSIQLERQKQELLSHAAWFRLTVCDTIIESNTSPDTLDRPGLKVAIQRMEELQARSLLVNSLDDLTTHRTDLDWLLKQYFQNGFVLYSGRERLNSSTPEGCLMLAQKQLQMV